MRAADHEEQDVVPADDGPGPVSRVPQTTSPRACVSRARTASERRVLALLRDAPLSRAELARRTGLSAQAMTRIVRALSGDGLVRSLAPVRGQVGQPSTPLALEPRGAHALGLAIGRRGGEVALVDFAGAVLERTRTSWRWPDPDEVRDFAAAACATLAPRAGRASPHGLGVSMPWDLWQWHERLDAPRAALERWRGHDIEAVLADVTGLPVTLGNDAAAACGAELTWGGGAALGDFAHFSVGFFAGGGLAIGGTVHGGRRGRGAAFGSLPVPDASGRARAAQLIDEASVHVLETMLDADGHRVDPQRLAAPDAAAWSEAPATIERWERRVATALATAVASVACVVDLDHVVVDGPLPTPVRTRLCSRVRAALEDLDTRGLTVPPVLEGSLGSRGAVLGAARLALERDFLP